MTQHTRHLSKNLNRAAPRAFAPLRPLFWIGLISLPLSTAACGGGEAGGGGFGGMPPTPVEVAEVEPHTVRDGFHALGSVDAEESIEVVSEIDGILEEIPFSEGQPLQKGDLIARLDDREIGAASRRDAALVEEAERDYSRGERLFQEGAISESELENLRTDLQVTQANLAVSQARFEKTRIRAPFSGVAGRRRVSPGAYVRTGQVITELGRLNIMRVSFSAPERYASRLKPGVPIELTNTAYPGELFKGYLAVVDPIIDPETRTIQLVAKVPNRERKLKPGMSANVTAVLEERDMALVVPDEAIFAQGNLNFVYVVNADSSVRRAPVQLGTRDSALVEIVGGLGEGDLVVRAGHQKLFDGARVMPINPDAPAQEGEMSSETADEAPDEPTSDA